jgi:hypothetical protein
MRFKTYGLYVRSCLTSNNEDNGTWCQIEFPLFEDHQPSLDIRLIFSFFKIENEFFCLRLCSTKIDYADLIGFNNTGNTCRIKFEMI